MERSEVKFRARDQVLTFTGGIRRYASDTVNYVEAYFELQDNWNGFDVVAAVWNNGSARIATDLDSDGKCRVPQEVLSKKGDVYVNLTGTTSAGNAVTERLTSYPVWVLAVDAKSHIRGTETAEITPSQFEQFASNVRTDADRAYASRAEAAQSASEAAQSAESAGNFNRGALINAEQAGDSEMQAQASAQDASASAQAAQTSADASATSATSAAQSASNAMQYAQNADDSADAASMASTYAGRMKDLAEQAKTSAESARDTILGMSATATTLEAGSEATANYSDGLLAIGVPRGEKGEKGEIGSTGAQGEKGEKGDRGDKGETTAYYGTCTTEATSSTKVVTVADSSFTRRIGVIVFVHFANDSCGSVAFSQYKMNVNDTGDYFIFDRIQGSTRVYASGHEWLAGQIIPFVYSGGGWVRAEKNSVQSDWNATSTTSDAYIKNKPTIPSYTAGTGIDITNGVISIDLDNAEGSGY
jgi:hypothetical protein